MFTLPLADREVLESLGYKEKLAEVDKAILANAEFLKKIVDNPAIFGHDMDEDEEEVEYGGEEDDAMPDEQAEPSSFLPTVKTYCESLTSGHRPFAFS